MFLCTRIALIVALLPLCTFAQTAPTVTVPAWPNPDCPVMAKKSSASLFVDTEGGRIYICCAPCIRKIRADEKVALAAAYPTVTKVGNTICPVSGKALPEGHPTIVLQGKEIGVCCKDCLPAARQQHQVTLARAHDPKLTVVGNKTCPIANTPVDANAIVVISGSIVHLSSLRHLAAVEKDAAGTLERAKASVKTEKPGEGKTGA